MGGGNQIFPDWMFPDLSLEDRASHWRPSSTAQAASERRALDRTRKGDKLSDVPLPSRRAKLGQGLGEVGGCC
jgi:hypothetical protein